MMVAVARFYKHGTMSASMFRKPLKPLQRVQSLHNSLTSRVRHIWTNPEPDVSKDEVARLAATPRRHLTLTDLIQYGRPPLSEDALLASANFTLSLLPARLASRIQALQNLPFIVVSNPSVSKIYHNYLHSLSTLLPYQQSKITTLQEESQFGDVLADLVQTHTNTIPVLAQGFLESRKYVCPADVTRFLDTHLRARIGTRLMAEQHLALRYASDLDSEQPVTNKAPSNYIGVIDTTLKPAEIVHLCEDFVGEICELKYGIRPRLEISGETEASFAHIPVHLEYIITELLKNAFRATIESGNEQEPIQVTIAAAPDMHKRHVQDVDYLESHLKPKIDPSIDNEVTSHFSSQSITIRIRDRGGGIPPEVFPNIWSYAFTTFSDMDIQNSENNNLEALNTYSNSGGNLSSIAGLGYGLPLSRAYAEFFGGGIAIQNMVGWGTDVYLTLRGIGKID